MTITLENPNLTGSVKSILSKSHVHRLLIAASLFGENTQIVCDTHLSADINATINCLRALGADIELCENILKIKSNTQSLKEIKSADFYCGESGSTFRFMLPVVCALGINSKFFPEGRLPNRPLSPLREELISHGCHVESVGTLPFTTSGTLNSGIYEIAGNVSSQYITGLLFALPLLEENSEIHIVGKLESRPYVDMTLEVLEYFGVDIVIKDDSTILIGGKGNNRPKNTDLTFYADGDWSNAAFWLTAGAIGKNKITVTGLRTDSAQGDKEILMLLKQFGAGIEINTDNKNGLSDITVSPAPLKGIEIDAADIPDLVPILSLAASCAEGTTKIYNAQRLRLKESGRIATVHDVLSTLGADIQETQDGLVIKGISAKPNEFPLTGGTVSSHNDHRIAMTAAIAACVCSESVTISNAEAVNKSYTTFWQEYEKLNQK